MSNIYEAIQNLEWFFSAAESSMGICSNFGAIRNALLSGGVGKSSKPDGMNDVRMASSERYRDIAERLSRIDSNHRHCLHAAYSPRDYGTQLWNAFGRSTGVTQLTTAGIREFALDSNEGDRQVFFAWLQGCCARNEDTRVTAIRNEAQRLLDDAHRAYAAQD